MTDVAIVGLGKMGISHLAILGAHPDVRLVGACDGLTYLTKNLQRYSGIRCFNDLDKLLDEAAPDALLIATPTRSHAAIARQALERDIAVFCEKPFVLDVDDGAQLIELCERKAISSQVGYHYRFVSTFEKAARIVASGLLGKIHHVRVEAMGPVVTKPAGVTWRAKRMEGGGAIYDYACHAIDLVHFIAGRIDSVDGVVRNSVFSKSVDDEVYASLLLENGASGQLSVNWSDPSHRKMFTRLSLWGEFGSLVADRQEVSIYIEQEHPNSEDLGKGWNSFNITQLTEPTAFYLRGEEYTKQIDYFIESVGIGRHTGRNCFASAYETDLVVADILSYTASSTKTTNQGKESIWARLGFGSARRAG